MKSQLIAAACAGIALSATSLPVRSEDPAMKLSREELMQLMPGKKVTHVSKIGSTRHWTNESDGTVLASWVPIMTGSGKFGGTAKGTWTISDGGKYCVAIDWQHKAEKWCRFIFRAGDGYAMSASDDASAERERLDLK